MCNVISALKLAPTVRKAEHALTAPPAAGCFNVGETKMQHNTLQECGRLFKQQLRQQEQMSLQVLDQVQESISLLRTLYRSRMPLLTTEAHEGHSFAKLNKVKPTERVQRTETDTKDNELEKQQQSIIQQCEQSSLQMMYQRRLEQGQQLAYEKRGTICGVSYLRHTGGPPPDEDLSQSEGKEAQLQRPGVERTSPHEDNLDTVQRRGKAFGRGQCCSVGHERQSHTNTDERDMLAASSQAYTEDGEVTDSAKQATLFKATQVPTGTSSQAPAAAASGSAVAVINAPRSAVPAVPCSTSLNEPQPCAPEATVTPNNSGDEVQPNHSRSDIPRMKDVHKCVSTGNALPRCIRQNTLHYVQVDQSKAPQNTKEQVPQWCEAPAGLYPINTRKSNSQAPERLLENAPPAAAAAASEFSSEQIFERNHRPNFAADRCRNAAEDRTTFFSAVQDQTKQSRIPHECSHRSCCNAQEAPRRHGEQKQKSAQNSAAPMTGYAKSARVKDDRDGRTHICGGLPQEQRAASPVQIATAAADVSLLPPLSCTVSRVCVGHPSSLVAKNKAVVHIRKYHNATTTTDGKTVSPAGTANADTGSKSDSETDGTSFATSGTCGDAAAHEAPCTEMHLAVTHSHIPARSLAHCSPRWSERYVPCHDDISQRSSSCSSQSLFLACGSSTTDTDSEDTQGSFPHPSLPAKDEAGNENQLAESRQRWQKRTSHRGGRCGHQKNVGPSRKPLLEPDMRTEDRGAQHCQDQQRQGTSTVLSQIVGSSTQKSKRLHLLPQQGSACHCVGSRTPDTCCSELSCAYSLHRTCSGYTLKTRGIASGVVGGEGHSRSLPTLSTTTENCCTAYTCQTVAAQDRGVRRRVPPGHSGTCWKKDADADSISTPSPPPLNSNRPAVSRPKKPSYASSVRPATSVGSRLNSCAEKRSLFTSCCDNPQQLSTRQLDDTRRARPLWKRTPGSLLCTGPYLAAVSSSRFRGFSQEIPPFLARESESSGDYASPSQISNEAAQASSRSRSCIVDKKHCIRVALVTPVSCSRTAFSPVASSSPAAPTVHMTGEAEGSVTSQETHCRPSACALSSPFLLSALRDTVYIASPSSRVPPTSVQLQNQPRRGSASTSTSTPQATYCPLCRQPFHCNASAEAGAEQLLLPPQRTRKSCSAFCAEETPAVRILNEPHLPGTRAVTGCASCSENKLEDRYSPPCSGDHLRGGTEGERLYHIFQIPVPSGASRCSWKAGNDNQLHGSSCTAIPAKNDKRHTAAAVQPHFQLAVRGDDSQCDTPAKQTPTRNTRHLPTAQTQRKAGTHDCSTKCSRCSPFVAAPPAWVRRLQAQRLGNTTMSSEGDGTRAAPTCEAETLSSPGGASAKLLKAPSDSVVTPSATEGFHIPAKRKPSLSKRAMRLYPIHQVKQKADRLSFHQRQQDQQFQQEKSNALFPQFHPPPDQCTTTGPVHQRGHCQVPEELYPCSNEANDYEDAQGDSSSHNNSEKGPGFPCSLPCCSAASHQGQPPSFAGANETSETVEELFFPAETGRVGKKNADSSSERSSTRRLSTISTHVEDSDSTELSSPPGTTVNQEEIHHPRPQRGTNRRKLPKLCPNGDTDGNSTPDNTSQQREGIFTGKRGEQCTRDELTDTLRQPIKQLTPSSQAHVASKGHLGLIANNPRNAIRLRVHPHSSPACCPCTMTMTSPYVKGQRDAELDGETSNAGGQYEVCENWKGATQQEVTADKCQRHYRVKHPQGKGDHRLPQNALHLMRTEQPGSHAGTQRHFTGKPVTQAPERDTECHATGPEHVRQLRYEHLIALVHPECAAAAAADATEPRAPPQPSAFIFRLAAAEAAAILRQEE